MPRFSCIIPVVGDVRHLEATLVSVLANRPDDCELLVVLSTPYDDPYDLASEVRFLEAAPATGYVGCANLGVRASAASIVHLLAAGLEVSEGWSDAALEHFRDPTVAAVAPVVRAASGEQRVLNAGAVYTCGGRRKVCEQLPGDAVVGPAAAAAFYRKSALIGLGGLSEELGGELADVDVALMLSAAGWRTVVEPRAEVVQPVVDRSTAGGRGFRYGRAAEQLFWRNLSPGSRAMALAAHAGTILAEAIRAGNPLTGLAQLAGRVAALGSFGDCAAHRRQLDALRASAATAAVSREETVSSPPRRIDGSHASPRAGKPSNVAATRR